MYHDETCVAIYPRHALAEKAVAGLRCSGIETGHVSIVGRGRGSGSEDAGGQGSPVVGGRFGPLWSGICAADSATFFSPDLGFLVVEGPLSRWIQGALESGFAYDGLGPIAVALHGVGVPLESARRYEGEVRENRCLLVFPCPSQDTFEIARALRATGPRELRIHECETIEARK